jgi:hypothetical protein
MSHALDAIRPLPADHAHVSDLDTGEQKAIRRMQDWVVVVAPPPPLPVVSAV